MDDCCLVGVVYMWTGPAVVVVVSLRSESSARGVDMHCSPTEQVHFVGRQCNFFTLTPFQWIEGRGLAKQSRLPGLAARNVSRVELCRRISTFSAATTT